MVKANSNKTSCIEKPSNNTDDANIDIKPVNVPSRPKRSCRSNAALVETEDCEKEIKTIPKDSDFDEEEEEEVVKVVTKRRQILSAKSQGASQPKSSNGPTRDLEKRQWKDGYWAVGGADEAGRGPLAGPVVAAVCVLARRRHPTEKGVKEGDTDVDFESLDFPKGVADSKQLTEEQREALYEEITTHPYIRWAVSIKTREEIDNLNILNASLLAMADAATSVITAVPGGLDYLLVDGNKLPKTLTIPAKAVVKGDATSSCIAAASIIAKVTRDRLMDEMDKVYPLYGFRTHKGYGVPAHLAALRLYGPCIEHRLSYNPVRTWVGFARDLKTGKVSMTRTVEAVRQERLKAGDKGEVEGEAMIVEVVGEEGKTEGRSRGRRGTEEATQGRYGKRKAIQG